MLKKRQDRNQVQMRSLEESISRDNVVRVIDVFVDALDLNSLGFKIKGKIKNGAPAYLASDLLKLYYYGYLNRVRSSRRLEREARTNIEAMWLLRGVCPGYKTIANFRKDNLKSLEAAFYSFNRFLRSEDLFDTDTVSIDGSKFGAQNSKKNNYNEKKVNRHLDYIAKQTKRYLEEFDEVDKEEESEPALDQQLEIEEKLQNLVERKQKYEVLKEEIAKAREQGESQVSTTDKDARSLPKKMNIVEVSYNVLTGVEHKNKMICNYHVDNKSDTYQLSKVALKSKEVLKVKGYLKALADKGFDTGSELKKCIENKIHTYVAPKKRGNALKDKAFNKDQFMYDEETDEYICPENKRLKPNEKWYTKNNGKHRQPYKVRHYKLPYHVCKECPYALRCAGAANLKNSKGRYIERSEYQEYIEENIERVKGNKILYSQRQSMVEHPFGTIKRQWGYDHTLLKTKSKVRGEFAIIFTVYNLRRAISILGPEELIKRIKAACIDLKTQIGLLLRHFKSIFDITITKQFLEKSKFDGLS